MEDEKLSSCMLMKQSEETVDHVSLYLTPLAFGAPTGGSAPCSNIENAFGACCISTLNPGAISSKITKNFAGGVAPSIPCGVAWGVACGYHFENLENF
ncbi:hypothetical protein T07_9987 [Trichinella nelsoni]|uniref:Uncharacterized protein n=1 Tax=Trichinella nelsoni TaxID=6336 RepID=A0A0V0RDP1_9BILA|nr:hypothetical protein T07_9987 [Trichinella nelsoni]